MSPMEAIAGEKNAFRREDVYPFRRTDFAFRHLSVCAALALGEFIGFLAAPASALWPLMVFVLTVFVLIGFGWHLRMWRLPCVFLLGLTLALCSEARRSRTFDQCDYSSQPLEREFPVEGRVTVSDVYIGFDSSSEGVEVRVMIQKPQDGAMSLPMVGEVWQCSGWLDRQPREDRRRRSLWVSGRGCSVKRIREAPRSSLEAWLRRLRAELSHNIGYGLGHDGLAADLDRAMIIGERANLPPATRQMFADAGTVHVFAISGLHVGVVAWMLVYILMTIFCFPLRWVVLPLAPILAGYVMMIDAPPSAVRAAVMAIAYFAAPLFLRRPDSLIAWSVTFVAVHVCCPAMLMNVGSLLSFTVMLGILLYARWAEAFEFRFPSICGITMAAWLSGVAIAARVFERLTVGGLFANIVIVPLASLAVVFGALGAVIGSFCPWVAAHMNNASALLIEAMAGISWISARIPYANIAVVSWPMWMCFAWYVGLALAFWLVRSVYLHHRKLF